MATESLPKALGVVSLRVDRVYGNLVAYPVCERAKALAAIAGTKTLTMDAIAKIPLLGFDVEFVEGSAKAMNEVLNERLGLKA